MLLHRLASPARVTWLMAYTLWNLAKSKLHLDEPRPRDCPAARAPTQVPCSHTRT